MKSTSLITLLVLLLINTATFGAGSCPEGYSPGRYNGPCLPDKITREQLRESDECRDKPEAEKLQCLRGVAQRNSSRNEKSDYDTSKLGKGAMVAVHAGIIFASAYAINFWMMKKKQKIQCTKTPPSMYMISAGALSLLGAEVLSYIKYSKKISEMKNDLSALQAPDEDDPDTSQNDYYNHLTEMAFDKIIQKEQAYLEATKVRRIGYGIGGAMFGAASVSAIFEGLLDSASYTCHAAGDTIGFDLSKVGQSKSNRSGGGGSMGMLLGFLPMLLGLVTDAGTEMAIPANSFENLDQLQLPSESKRLLSSLNQTQSLEELNIIMKESEMFKSGAISSPTIEEFQKLKTHTKLSFTETTNWKDQKEIMMMGALLTSQYDELGFLFSSDQVAVLK